MNDNFDDLKRLGIENPNDPEQIEKVYGEVVGNAHDIADAVLGVGGKDVRSDLKQTLTDENIEELQKVAEANNPDKDLMEQAAIEADGEHEGYVVEGRSIVNPETGEKIPDPTIVESPYITETFEEFIANHANDEIEMKITDDGVGLVIQDVTGSEAEAAELSLFVDALKQYQDGNINAQEAYRCMPSVLKEFVDVQLKSANFPHAQLAKYHNTLIKNILDNIISDAAFDNYIIDMNNQMAEIYGEFGKEANKFYEESMAERIKSLEEFKAELTDEDVEKKQAVDDIMAGLNESVEMNELKEAAKKIKIKKFDLEKPERFVSTFNAKYTKSKYNIQNITHTMSILHHKVGLSQEDCLIFLVVFCKFCMNYRPTNFKEHVFMYYTIANIIALAVAKDEYSETGQKVVDSVKEVIANSRIRNNMPAKEEVTTDET